MKIPAKHIHALAKSLNNLADAIDQILQNPDDQPAPAPKPKKASLKKKSVKTIAKKSAPKKKSAKAKAKKSAKKPTKIDVVLATIQRARNGIDTATLLKRTGFDKRTISNSIYKLKKENKIKSPKKGEYAKV